MLPNFIIKSPEVQAALEDGRPIVALESTVIAHGLPQPLNLQVANRLQNIVTEVGAVPATIAILKGQLRAGLSSDEIELIATTSDVRKVSMRDLPIAVAQKLNCATTVATTLWIAHRLGIKVFATGGIGGVHRGTIADVSADLPVLAGTPMVVVCSGAKIVLDLFATREWLETHGVTVIGYQCDELPAFYSRTSGLPIDVRTDSPAEVADLLKGHRALGLSAALLVVVPVPQEAEVPHAKLEQTLDAALAAAADQGITGRDLTPFLLSQMAKKSDGATLRANIALLENNARVAAEIAMAIQPRD